MHLEPLADDTIDVVASCLAYLRKGTNPSYTQNGLLTIKLLLLLILEKLGHPCLWTGDQRKFSELCCVYISMYQLSPDKTKELLGTLGCRCLALFATLSFKSLEKPTLLFNKPWAVSGDLNIFPS